MRRILVVVGTRPEAIKLAPVVQELRATAGIECRVLATAQHRELLDRTLAFFGIVPDRDLDLMRPGQGPADLLARAIAAIEPVLADEAPDFVLLQGDTTTVLAAALAAFHRRVPFGHVEAGLRTGDLARPFPEEGNRRLVAPLARVHFAPTTQARDNLLREGIAAAAIHVVGNTVVDAVQWTARVLADRPFAVPPGRRLLLVTAHRRESFGKPLAQLCEALAILARRPDVEVVFPVHPNPRVRETVERLLGERARLRLCDPFDYPEMVAAMQASTLVLTDSGGVQEEAPALGKPVLVLRDVTERPEGVALGAAILVGMDRDRIVAAAERLLDDPAAYSAMAVVRNPYGDGRSARAIVDCLARLE
ncbi:MAG: UDP-N-acetylglucosamine 2-epimerase (non-hydrolyzing) [Planctomycetes bacterium]|nr:UDP-N-acetylglucosamine 2-epimerase (non-hydrolyzing) [Planctomycetota bacterium]